MSLPFRSLAAAGGALVAFALAASPAAAADTQIVYVCANGNLCSVDPAGGAEKPLTSDGGYASPSLSADGKVLAAAKGDAVMSGAPGGPLAKVADSKPKLQSVAISPTGAVLYDYEYTSMYTPPPNCIWLSGMYSCFPSTPMTRYHNVFVLPGVTDNGSGEDVSFLGGDGAVVATRMTGELPIRTYGCVLRNPADTNLDCNARLFGPGDDSDVYDAAGSFDGTKVVAWVGGEPANGAARDGAIAIFDANSGQQTATVVPGGASGDPVFSPDGSQIAYSGVDGGIWVVPAAGGPARRVATGSAPAWGGAPAATMPPVGGGNGTGRSTLAAKRLRRGTLRIPVACAARCRVAVRLVVGAKTKRQRKLRSATIATGRAARAGKGTVTVRLRLTKGSSKALRSPLPARLKVTVKTKRAKTTSMPVTVR